MKKRWDEARLMSQRIRERRSKRLMTFDPIMFWWVSAPPPKNYAALIALSPVIMTQEQYLVMQWDAHLGQRRVPCSYSRLVRGKTVVSPEMPNA